MRTLLLEMSLGNEANDCFMNTALIGELWACCMDNTFSWDMLGTWKEPLIRLLDRGPNSLGLSDPSSLGTLLDGWFASHAKGAQHDVAEFLGWLRHTMHRPIFVTTSQVWDANLQLSFCTKAFQEVVFLGNLGAILLQWIFQSLSSSEDK